MFSFFKRLDKGDKRTLFICFYGFCFSGILSMTMGSVMPDLKAAYNLSDATSGLLLSAHSAGNLVAGLVSGMVPLWLGQRRSITLLSAMAVLGYFMLTLFGVPAWLRSISARTFARSSGLRMMQEDWRRPARLNDLVAEVSITQLSEPSSERMRVCR